jgi:hypothetical protein
VSDGGGPRRVPGLCRAEVTASLRHAALAATSNTPAVIGGAIQHAAGSLSRLDDATARIHQRLETDVPKISAAPSSFGHETVYSGGTLRRGEHLLAAIY